jgi:hypothetical protein
LTENHKKQTEKTFPKQLKLMQETLRKEHQELAKSQRKRFEELQKQVEQGGLPKEEKKKAIENIKTELEETLATNSAKYTSKVFVFLVFFFGFLVFWFGFLATYKIK